VEIPQRTGRIRRFAAAAYALILIAFGLPLAVGGALLVHLHGSPYYLLAGAAIVLAGLLIGIRWAAGVRLYDAVLLVSLVWAVWEVGFDAWALASRLLAPAILGLGLRMPWVRDALRSPAEGAGEQQSRQGRERRRLRRAVPSAAAAAAAAAVALVLGAMLHALGPKPPPDPQYRAGIGPPPGPVIAGAAASSADWPHYGNDAGGTRFSGLSQITPDNVGRLTVAWTYRTGDPGSPLEATPLKVGDSVFLCTGSNDVIALDAETGALRWRFRAGTAAAAAVHRVCRGVAYYRVPHALGECAERIITNTIDARLIALDARNGRLCGDFGSGGQTSLLTGMGDAKGRILPGYYYPTSAPTVVHGKIILGGWVSDAQYWGEPSGTIRAFDAVTGKFAWAFDMGRPERHDEPAPGEQYTPSTPNSWAPMSADEQLGLVYVPTGNTSGSDYYGASRRPFDEKYSSSVVAIDADSGEVRWSFQTVHHDLWDYDVASQPVLVDLPRAGGMVHALVQASKPGEIFVLDRTTGQPLFDVAERPVPSRGAVAGERLSATQPVSTALPAFRGPDLTEKDMWGVTPIDQLACRIRFKRARYQGIYTPPGIAPFIEYPGILGGIDWGGVSVDPQRALMMVNASRVANYAALIPRALADAAGLKPEGLGGRYSQRAQAGTPYAVSNPPFLSRLEIPCQRPPYGTLSAVNLLTGKLVWSRRLGTARDSGPFGIPLLLPLPLGTPNTGGSLSTRSGLVFIGATQDRYLRAYAAETGRLMWSARLPAGAQATPMTYESTASRRQFVVIAAGGSNTLETRQGDYVVAYALPK